MKKLKLKSTKSKIMLGAVLLLIVLLIGGAVYALDNRSTVDTVEQTATSDTINTEPPEQVTEQPIVTATEPAPAPPVTTTVEPKPVQTPPASQWPVQLTNAQAASITVVVNKKHKLPSTYIPNLASVSGGQLRTEAANAFNSMVNAASGAGVSIAYGSGYRSYARQRELYNNYVAQDGQAAADTYSARQGHSEHQTGLAVDVKGSSCYLETCFANTPAGQWVANNAHNYGFIIRYPSGKESITGYQYEPWHLRFLGVDIAKDVYSSGKTLEEYYSVPGGNY